MLEDPRVTVVEAHLVIAEAVGAVDGQPFHSGHAAQRLALGELEQGRDIAVPQAPWRAVRPTGPENGRSRQPVRPQYGTASKTPSTRHVSSCRRSVPEIPSGSSSTAASCTANARQAAVKITTFVSPIR